MRKPTPEATPSPLAVFRSLPKAELHLHLDGALRPATALELGRERRLPELAGLDLHAVRRRLEAPLPCRDQAELLRAFDLPVAILQDAESLARVARELVLDLAADGIVYAEIRWAPGLHTRRGLSLRDGIAAVVDGVRAGVAAVADVAAVAGVAAPPTDTASAAAADASASARRSDGIPPIAVRLIAVAMRSAELEVSERVARAAVDRLADGLTGFDLAGPEAAFPDVRPHAPAFAIARSGGLGITVHAAEWGGADQVRRALAIDPWRIAHGAPAADDPALMALLRERDITLDVCPTSNWQAGLVPRLALHPLPRLIAAGVPTSLSTDDPTVSAVTLSEEYRRAHDILGLDLPTLAALDRQALRAAFLQHDETLRAALQERLETYLQATAGWQA